MAPRGRPPRKVPNPASAASSGHRASHKKSTNGPASGAAPTQRARDKTRGQGARLYSDPFNDERQLEAQLKRLGLYAANTLGDGSCLFRALSDQLHGNPNHHLTIRHEVCNFLLACRDEFIAFIDDSHHSSPEAAYAAHVAEMRNSATYGTQLEIVAFARMVKRRVKVVQAELVYVIGYEDESPSARDLRASRRDSKGKAKDMGESLPDLYIVYHNWEHYSSARNIVGPHTGLPCIIEQQQPMPGADPDITSEDIPKASQEESLVLSSLRYPHRHTVTEIRKLIHDHSGSWERALESLLENEIDETESEDFNLRSTSPQSPRHVSLPSIGVTAATPAHLTADSEQRSSSPSASSSTATSGTNMSQSTTATQLSDLPTSDTITSLSQERKKKPNPPTASRTGTRFQQYSQYPVPIAPAPAPSPAPSAIQPRIRSRAASPDAEFSAAESPRQRFRLSRDAIDKEDSSSYGGDDATTQDASSPGSSNSAEETYESSSAAPTPPPRGPVTQQHSSPVKSSRFPKRKETLSPANRGPTRRQRKQLSKAGGPLGVATRSSGKTATPMREESGLQREFRELYV